MIEAQNTETNELKPWEMFGKTEQPENELKPWEKFAKTEQLENELKPWEMFAKAKESNFYAPRAFERERLYKAFAGDPLAVLDDNLRPEMEFYANREANPDEMRKRVALAAYFSMMDKKKFSFALENLDGFLDRYYAYTGKKMDVNGAYEDISGMLATAGKIAPAEQDGSKTGSLLKGSFSQLLGTVYNLGTTLLEGAVQYENVQRNLDGMGTRADEIHKDFNDVRNVTAGYYKDIAEKERAKLIEPDWATLEGVQRNGVAGTMKNLTLSVLFEAPNMAAQAAVGAVNPALVPVVMGVTTAADKAYDLERENSDMNEIQQMANIIGTGLVNGYLEKVTMGIFKGSGLKLEPETLKAGMKEAFKYYLKSIGKEGLEESAEQLAENAVDIATGRYGYGETSEERLQIVKEHLFEGVLESGLVGGAYGAPFAGVGHRNLRRADESKNRALNMLRTREAELKAKSDLTEIETAELRHIQTTLESGNLNETLGLAQDVAVEQEAKRRADAEAAVERDAEMTSEERADAARQDYQLRRSMAHNPEDTADAVAETGAGYKVNVRACGTAEIASMETGRNAEEIRAFYDPETDTVVVNTDRVRPSEVPYLFLHEVAVHKGLDAVFGESRKNAVLDGLYGQMHEQIEAVNTGYGFDLDTTEGRRAATEEYLAECAEFCGHDWRKFDRENEEDVTRWLAEHNMALMRRKEGVRGVLEERGELSVRPAWWREFLQKVKMFFYGFKGFSNYRFTDKEIETLLLRGYRKTRSARGAKAEGGDARFAALRREGAPNTAEESGQMRDSRVPHEEGFMEKYKFSGKGLYADYEFLYGRHPEYFEDVEHVRAAVEFVLAQPEEAVDVEGNAAFVRRDEETGTPYRIEIEKTTRAKYNHIRSVHVLSEQQYEKAKAGATPANAASPVLQPSQNRVRQTDTNGDLTGRQGRTVSDFLRYDSTESGKVKHSPEGGARFSIIGEEGAGRGREAEKRPYYQIPFSEGLARVVDPAQKDKREPVFVCTTPEIMRKIGFTALPIMMNARHLRLNYYTAEEFRENYGKLHKEDHAHSLHEALKTLPKVLEHPLAVVVNMTENAKPGSVVVITDMDIGGKKVVVPVLIETVSNTNKGDIDSHLVLTVYDSKDWINTFLKPALEEEKKNRVGIFYFDEKKASRYSVLSKNKKTITAGYLHTIHDEGSPVKGEFKKQTETLQFKEWFGKSKVVDEEGKPLVVYHGSTADFTEFSYKFVNRNGQADGRGFYFTDNRSFAEGYQNKDGKLFEVYLSIQKPLNPDKLTITKAELRKILDAIDPSGDYMANYAEDDRGYPGAAWRAKALNSTVNAIYDSSENNADILAELYSSFGGGEVLAEVRKVSGYDGFIKKDQNGNMIYIAFEPGQIKSATDNIGTYDRNNPDIRFSIEQDEDFLPDGGRWGYTLENARASKEGYRVERVNENAGREFNEADGVVCIKDVVFTSSELPKTGKMKWIKERLVAYSREHGVLGLHETSCLDDFVKVTENGIVNDLNHRGTAIRQNMIAVIPEMLKNAVLIQTESDRRSKTHILAVKVRYGDERFVVGLVVNENNGKYFYDHELTEINAVVDGTSEKTDAGQTKASVLNVIRKALLSSGFDTKSEKNLRFSIEQYSDADWSDMVTYLKAKVGNLLTKPDGEYKKILEDAGMECYSEADAHACAVEAMNANLKDAQARRKAEMMNWIVENNAWIQRISEVTGSPEFKIRPSYRFQGMDFTGSYISREWRDCSGNPKAKNREKRLEEASGYHSDELAQMIADKYGGDAIEIENDLIEYFQHKKKKASKTERENGELGVYDEYYAFKKEERLFNRELDRQLQKQWEAQEARIGDEIKDILEEKRVIGEELAETDFEVFASLYRQVTGEEAPEHPSAEQLDALNAAIQEGGDTPSYIRGWEAGRERMLSEKRKEFSEFVAQVTQEKSVMKDRYRDRLAKEREKRREEKDRYRDRLAKEREKHREQAEKFAAERANIRESNLERLEERARENARELQLQREANLERQEEMVRDDADKLYLQRQAEEFAKKNVPAEQRGEFIRGIVDLAKYSYLPTKKYPNGQRKAKLQELFERMATRGEEVRKEKLIEETEKLFKQAGLRADATRKQRNVLSFDVQRIVDRCREYADLSAEEAEILSAEMAQRIDNSELTGNAQADLVYEARLLDLFGNYRGKSASEIELARAELKTLVNTGRSELKQQIRERVQADGLARSDITAGLLNGENPLTPQQRRALEAKRKREKTKRVLAETNWKSNSLDSLLSYLELPSGVKVETVEELQRKLYRSNDGKMTRSRKHAEELEAKLNEFCGVDPAKRDSFTARKARAELIRKWRERPEKTGIIRGQPNEMTQYMKRVRVPAEEAHAKLKEFQAQGREVEAAALEHLLNTERLRIKRGDVTSGDAVTDALVKEMRKMQESDQEKAYFIPELRLGANPVEEKLTQLEALYMRLMWGQKNVKYKMRFNGWTESSMKQIDAYLKPEVKEFGEWMVKQLERDRADIEAVYEKLYFSMFPHEENYFPSVYNPTRETIDGRMTTDLSQEGAGKQPMAYTPGAVKLRAFHLMEPKICDALNVFVNHRMQMDHFVTHGETSRELRSIFANRDVAQTIRDVYGGEYYDQLRKEISDFIHGGNTEVQNTQFAQTALNNFTRMKMLWNLVSAGKQVFGGISYFAFSGVPAKAMAAGIVDFWKHPAENAKRLLETEYSKNRWQGGMNREMKAIMDSTGLCAGNMQLFLRELDHAGFMLMRAGDAFPVLVYGHAVYKYHYEQLVKQGLAPHEADIRAKEEWALATERTQQSGAPHMLNSWQKGNFAQKALVSFLSNPTLLFQSYSRDIYSQKRFGHGGWSAAKKIAVAGICSVLMSAINQMIRNGDDWDEYSLSDAVFSVLNDITVGWVGVGTLMSGIYDALSYGRAKTIPVLDDAGRAVRSGYRIAGEMAEGDLNEENLRDAIALLQGLGLFWSPAAQVSALGREGRRWWQFFTGEKKK